MRSVCLLKNFSSHHLFTGANKWVSLSIGSKIGGHVERRPYEHYMDSMTVIADYYAPMARYSHPDMTSEESAKFEPPNKIFIASLVAATHGL